MILEISYLISVDSLAASYRGYYWGYLSDDIFGSDKELKELQFVSVFCSALSQDAGTIGRRRIRNWRDVRRNNVRIEKGHRRQRQKEQRQNYSFGMIQFE